MVKRLLALTLVLVTTQWLFFSTNQNNLGYITPPWFGTLSFFILMLMAHVFLYIIFKSSLKRRNSRYSVISSTVALVAACVAITKGSFIDQFLLTILSISATCVSLYLLALTHSNFGALSEIVTIPFELAVTWYLSAIKAAETIWLSLTKNTAPKLNISNNKLSTVIIGAIITIPVLLVLVTLLSSADPIFSKLVENLFSLEWIKIKGWVILRSVFATMVLIVTLPLFFFNIKSRYRSRLDERSEIGKLPGIAYILATAVAITMAVFLIIQYKYLFANVSETQLHQFGVQTYSEYVRRGFSELLMVSLIIYAVSGFSFVVYRASNKAQTASLRIINFILLSEAAIFIFSIFRRIYLYQELHGFTRVRVYGGAFLLFMIALTVILALRHIYSKKQWYIYEIAAVIAFVFITTGINVDALISQYAPPTVNGEVDYVYIAKLSADAADGWLEAYDHAKSDISTIMIKPDRTDEDNRRVIYAYYTINSLKQEYMNLAWKRGDIDTYKKLFTGIYPANKPPVEWKELNLAELNAYAKFKAHAPAEEINMLSDQAQTLYSQIPPQDYNRLLDRGIESPLIY